MDRSQQDHYHSKRQRFLRLFLCARCTNSNASTLGDEPFIQHVPTHAAASFLRTATPSRMRQDQRRALSTASSTTFCEMSQDTIGEPANRKLQIAILGATTPRVGSEATKPPMTTLPSPTHPWAPAFNFDTPYPSIAGQTEEMRACGVKRVQRLPRDSLDWIMASKFGNHSAIWSEA